MRKSAAPKRQRLAARASSWQAPKMIPSATELTVTTHSHPALPALTTLADDERLFRDSVLEFAAREIRPLVRDMDEHAKIPRALIDKLFDLGVMGIEIPETTAAPARRFFHSVLAVEALSQVDPSIGVLVDVRTPWSSTRCSAGATDEIKRRYLPKMATATIGAYALSEAGSGSDAFAMTTRAAKTATASGRSPDASCGSPTATKPTSSSSSPTVNPDAGYRGITAFHRRARHDRLHRRQEGRQARDPRQQHVRAAVRGLPRAARQRPRRGRQGLQSRRSRRSTKDASASARR